MTSIIDTIFANTGQDNDTTVIERPPVLDQQNEETPAKPPMYAVILHNDASTHFHFVVRVLNDVFNVDRQRATQIMMAAHTNGKATVCILSKDAAETKADQAMQMVRQQGAGMNGRNPNGDCELTFTVEPETDGE